MDTYDRAAVMAARSHSAATMVATMLAAALVACSSGAAPSAGVGTASAPAQATASEGRSQPTASPQSTAVNVTKFVRFESSDPVMTPGTVDIYAPAATGPWPVVVMFHGLGGTTGNLATHAKTVAAHGYVVFVAEWGWPDTDLNIDLTSPEGIAGSNAQNACALGFAETRAADYGGDFTTVIVFGHSAGAMAGLGLAFAPDTPADGCLAKYVRPPDGLVTWEGDWLAAASFWTDIFTADPTQVDAVLPWSILPNRRDLPVAMVAGATSDMPDLALEDLAIRDPAGKLRDVIDPYAVKDGKISIYEAQALLSQVLTLQGNPVSLEVMPDSTHEVIGTAGWPVFLAAFDEVAGR